MAKPASSRCTLHCRYCCYIEKQQQKVMNDATLRAFIRQQIDAQPGSVVPFAWQGGEPTLSGLDFFRRVAAFQAQFANGKRIENVCQTNGILLNDAWCRFFREHGWVVAISVDGPAEMYDAYRVNRSGTPSHHNVINAIQRLAKHGVEYKLLCIVNNLNSQQPQRLYQYLRSLGTPFLQFIPLVEQDRQGNLTAESVSGEAWGRFLTAVFDGWVREDIGRVYVQLFDSTLGIWRGNPSQMCPFGETCGYAFAPDANGDRYQCDHYVYPACQPGNLHPIASEEMNFSHEAIAFGQGKKSALPDDCRRCDVLRFCQGDCPKHRFVQGKSALCHGYQHFFSHTAPHMRVMRDLLKQRRSPMELMSFMRNHR
ncbi:anaerobic sulfatase maturase [Kosakonia pseudosacchari]|uniref:Anaerobic sulfatase maturase n=2 Tax=Kosakonia pseudosacchari TaxID=1646340 RepID=A0ABX4IW09_9ENTR|nr:anaerobic sulfatase maturase [Kosakonia pseudosacchari]